eukprot:SAG11_NODE_17586_length_514_cov_0.872289_2_plen_73_part_01
MRGETQKVDLIVIEYSQGDLFFCMKSAQKIAQTQAHGNTSSQVLLPHLRVAKHKCTRCTSVTIRGDSWGYFCV